MPNHITNCLTIRGNDAELFRLRCSFQKDEDGDTTESIDFEYMIRPPDNMFKGNLSNEDRQRCAEKGIPNWYDWQVEHWGTKWNAYSGKILKVEPGALHITFLTAGASPLPIFDRLAGMGFKLGGIWKDEGSDEIHEIRQDPGHWASRVQFFLYQPDGGPDLKV